MTSSKNNQSPLSQIEGLLDLLLDLQNANPTGESREESGLSQGDGKSQGASVNSQSVDNSMTLQANSAAPIAHELHLSLQPQIKEERGEGNGDLRGKKGEESSNLSNEEKPLEVLSNISIVGKNQQEQIDNLSPDRDTRSHLLVEPQLDGEKPEESSLLIDESTANALNSLQHLLNQSFIEKQSREESSYLSDLGKLDDQKTANSESLSLRASNGVISSQIVEEQNQDLSSPSMLRGLEVYEKKDSATYQKTSSYIEKLSPESNSSIVVTEESDLEDSFTSFERLQRLILTPDLIESRELLVYLQEQFRILESKIYDPTELIKLILPLIAEILTIKVGEAREEMARAMAPIIDEMIQAKTQEDKEGISSALAPILPDAITEQVTNFPGEFATALAPEMGKAIKEQIELERDAMVDALYPVIGSTITKYMGEAITAINQKVENNLSPEGISRKLRARFHGVSEAELIFKEAMPFSIQGIFLIHKGSGLIVSEVQPFGKQRLESEMMAGMLTAIRSFVNDCIAQSGNISELDRIDYGNCEIVLEVAGYCYLAVVTEGSPPPSFLEKMRDTMITISQRHGKAIELFDGDPDSVPKPVHQLLESLTQVSDRPRPTLGQARNIPVAILAVVTLVLSVIFIPWGINHHRSVINRNIEEKTRLALTSDPELAVYRISVDAEGKTIKLSGKLPTKYLAERAGQITNDTAPNRKLENQIIPVKVPQDPTVVAGEVERATRILNQTERMAIWTTYTEGKVTVKGSIVQVADAQKITEALSKIPGVESVTNTAQLQPLALASRIYFDLNSAELKSSEREKLDRVKAFLNDYPSQNLRVIGYCDRNGNKLENQELAVERAKTVSKLLVNQGIDPRRLQVAGTTKPPTNVYADDALNLSRFVEFEGIAP